MVKFTIKCFMLATVLLIGVLFGMQLANEGLLKMKGYDDPNFSNAFVISGTKEGDVEAAILGTKVRTLDLQQKQQELEERKAFNVFSSIGRKLADSVHSLINKAVQ